MSGELSGGNWIDAIEDTVKDFKGTGRKDIPLFPTVPGNLEDGSDSPEERRKRKIKEIQDEVKFVPTERSKKALDSAHEIISIARGTELYNQEIIDSELRYQDGKSSANPHEYIITAEESRYKIFYRNGSGSIQATLSWRAVIPGLSHDEYRQEEAENASNPEFWTQADVETGADEYGYSKPPRLHYQGQDPYEDDSLGYFPIEDTQRTWDGITQVIERFRVDCVKSQHRPQLPNHPEF